MNSKGIFITFEGPEGCGKTTQIKLFTKYLKKMGLKFLLTREPGGTKISEKIRDILLDPKNKEMSPITEAYLYAASRAQHTREKIIPALREGKIVISDRYLDSSIIYQGVGRNIGIERVLDINKTAINGLFPDISYVLLIPPKIGLKRARNVSSKSGYKDGDRLEQENMEFHKKIYSGFMKLPEIRKGVFILDGNRDIKEISREIIGIFERKYGF